MAGDQKQRLNELKALKLEGLSKYSRDELAAFILDAQKTDPNAAIMRKLHEMEGNLMANIASLQSTCADLRQELKSEKARNNELQGRVDVLEETTTGQQRFLERIDERERARNVVVIGLSEDDAEICGRNTDGSKLELIFSRMNSPISCFKSHRLGKKKESGSPRPILVTFPDDASRKTVLEKRNTIKSDRDFTDLKIKKDQHPAIRTEWRRLFEAEGEAKNNAENRGCVITLDRQKRILLRDGVVIDRFQARF